MAKSKSGGSRAYLRGRIANDVYSIGKDGKGKKQQVVRSLAEQVKNPQTQLQMFGRMLMSTIMQAVSALTFIINHSFDSMAAGQPSISEFIRRNYALLKADATANPSAGNKFGLNKYQEKGAKAGQYVVSDGSAVLPAAVADASTAALAQMTITKTADEKTAGAIRSLLGVAVGDYITLVAIDKDGNGQAVRAIVASTLADDAELTAANVAQLFTFEGTVAPSVSLADTAITIAMPATIVPLSTGVIVSQQKNGSWEHNECTLVNRATTIEFTSSVALPTYPVGEEKFLNGGEL